MRYNLVTLKNWKADLLGFNCEDHESCIEAVKQNGYALEYVKNQTPELCIAAVKQQKESLIYVRDLSMLVDVDF